jgi:tetratricopeptide (TPR) repeat protein
MGLTSALHRSWNTAAAATALRRLAALVPADAAVWRNFGLLAAGASDGRRGKTVAERALALAPMDPGAWNLHGMALYFLLPDGSAQASLRRAIALEPADSRFLGSLDEFLHGPSIDWAKRASCLGPEDGEAASTLGMALSRVQRLAEARTILSKVLKRDPDHRRVHLVLAWITLGLGDLAEGWRLYAARFHLAGLSPPRSFPWPWWSGGKISGRLLVWAEQGMGEELVLATLLPDLLERNVSIVFECDPRLVSIFTRSFPGIEAIARSNPPDPRLLRSDIAA